MDDQPSGPLGVPPRRADDVDDDVRARRPEPPTAAPPRDLRSRLRGALGYSLAALVITGLVIWVVWRAGNQEAQTRRMQPSGATPVGTAKVTKGDMPIRLSGLGTVTPLATIIVQTQISGLLMNVGFEEGQHVNKGDFLAQIDPRPYQVALEQSQAQLAKDQAALANAELDLTRYKKLVAQNSIASQQLDTQTATVGQDKAQVLLDQAQIDTQKLNLVYCHIISPVTGRVGLRQVDPGNYVTPTSLTNGIAVVTQLQPISVIFTLPEDNLPAVLKQLHANATLQVTAFDRTGTTKLDTGTLETIDNQIDTTTGTVKLRARFDNRDELLFPNQFVNAQLLVDTLSNVDLVPTAAIQRGAPGTFVYLVKPDDTVTAQPVTLGPGDAQNIAVTKGLEPGQQVVVDGADRLKDGAKVTLIGAGQSQPAAPARGTPPAPATAAPAAAPAAPPPAPAADRPLIQRQQRSGG